VCLAKTGRTAPFPVPFAKISSDVNPVRCQNSAEDGSPKIGGSTPSRRLGAREPRPDLRAYWPRLAPLRAHLAHGSALLALDGMGEVPVGHTTGVSRWHPRQQLVAALADACPVWIAAGRYQDPADIDKAIVRQAALAHRRAENGYRVLAAARKQEDIESSFRNALRFAGR